MEEKIEVPKSLWEQFGALFAGKKPDPQTPATVTPEQFAAAMQERDDMKARLETLETEKKNAALSRRRFLPRFAGRYQRTLE